MEIHQETVSFLAFILLGCIYGVLFDFFRALRKVKKRNDIIVSIQDILYFIIVGVILIIFMYIFMKDNLRIYLFLSIMLGVVIYFSVFGNKITKIFVYMINGYNKFFSFIFLPFDVFRQIFSKQFKFFKNIANNCCKIIFNMIKSNYCKLLNIRKNSIQKR